MSGKKLTGRRRDFIKQSSRKSDGEVSVCYLIDVSPERFTGGGQVHLMNLVREFKRSDLGYPRSDLIIFGGPNSSTLVRFLWSFWVIPQVIFYHFSRQKFSLIHAHSLPAIAAGKILSWILGIPIVATIHGNTISDQDSPCRMARTVLSRFLEKWILTRIQYDVQITVSRNFLEVPNVNKNVVYVPNGVDLNRFRKFRKLPVGSLRNFLVLFVGRKNDLVKGFRILEAAMELVKVKFPEARLLVADGSVLKNRVMELYRRADLFVLPSLSEGFPLTLLEAWAAKLPVVATAVGEVPYLFEVGSFVNFQQEVYETSRGYIVKPGSAESLAEGIIGALRNKHLAKMGENGYNLAKNYQWDKIARSTFKIYESVISTH